MTTALDRLASSVHVLRDDDPDDRLALDRLQADQNIEFIDCFDEQLAGVRRLLPEPDPELLSETRRWVYYPWRRTVVAVLGPRGFHAVRLDRNKHLITAAEQQALSTLRVGVVGLSSGHAIAYTLATEGACGTLRLADFDDLELSNLNRVPAGVFDVGLNKATVAARRIAELDPYLAVDVMTSGLSPESVDEFLDGLDVVIEECDSLDIKVLLRQAARARGIPVLMATSDRGLVDVERYDVDPQRPIFHGLLGDIEAGQLRGLSTKEKAPYILNILDGQSLSARGAASLVEVGQTLGGWPQLASDIWVGAATVANAVRRIGLGEPLDSGRARVDVGAVLDCLDRPRPLCGVDASPVDSAQVATQTESRSASDILAEAAIRAPSGGNAQPWHIVTKQNSLTIRLAPEHTSAMDIGFRGSAVAVGAAMFNARVAAAQQKILGPIEFVENRAGSPLQATLHFGNDNDPNLAALYRPMLLRATNRRPGAPGAIDYSTVEALTDAAADEGGRLHLLLSPDEINRAARILALADRIRYLTPQLHTEMISELRWPGDHSPDSGIDVRSLELDAAELGVLDVLRRSDVMAQLRHWDSGAALAASTIERVRASSALAAVFVDGATLADFARGGSAMQAVWIMAQQRGLSVQPVSPIFLYGCSHQDLDDVSPQFAAELRGLQGELRALVKPRKDEHEVLLFRLFHAAPPSVRSRRRRLHTT